MAAMSWRTTTGLIVAGLVSGLLQDVRGHDSDPGLCRRQCEAEMKLYQKFFFKPEYLTDRFRQCLSQCPEPQTTPPATVTITTNPTTTTTESTPGVTTSASSTTTATTSTQKPGVECGLQKAGIRDDRQRIVGGVEAAPCEFPWLVFISILYKTCAGAILSPRHVLTAAHCVMTGNTQVDTQVDTQVVHVRAGSSSVSLAKVFPVVAINIHPLHDPGNQINDAAILTVGLDMPYSDCLGPICLPEPGAEAREADICVVAGWGTTVFGGTGFMPNLLKVELPIVDQDKCQDRYGQDRVNDRTFCAGDFYSGGRDSCQGDSGAPLMCRVQGHYFVYGIVSTGRNCAKPRLPGIYTKVGHPDISRFIHKTIDGS